MRLARGVSLCVLVAEWYKQPPGSAAPAIVKEQLFYFYDLQPANNSCPGDPLGPGRHVVSDLKFPIEDMLYATLLLSAPANVFLTSGSAAPHSFHAEAGVVSFEIPRHPGEQRL
jgi:glucan endo-1,3-alpha-glucosidase